jgi:membrane associated rhomboid family serine protease/Flp pilus assembly protein TadD
LDCGLLLFWQRLNLEEPSQTTEQEATSGSDHSHAAPAAERSRRRPDFTEQLRLAPATATLIAINVALFAAMVISVAVGRQFSVAPLFTAFKNPHSDLLIRWGANFGPLTLSGQWWRLLTATFVHVGIVHLLLNMWALWLLGFLAERIFGRPTYLFVYFFSGLVGSLTTLAWSPAMGIKAGASGAILGIVGALLVVFRFARLPYPPRALRSSFNVMLIYASATVLYGFFAGGFDNAGHLGGLLGGVLAGAAATFWGTREHHDEVAISFTGGLVLTFLLAAATLAVRRADAYIPLAQRGETQLAQNQVDAALTVLKKAEAAKPNNSRVHVLLGQAYMRKQQAGLAQAELLRAVDLEPKSAEAWSTLGLLYIATQRAQEATYALGRAAELAPKSADIAADYAFALQLTNRFDESIKQFNRALQLNPGMHGAKVALGAVYFKANKLDDALATLQQAAKESPGDADTQSVLAAVYRAKGMTAEAAEAGRKAEALKQR